MNEQEMKAWIDAASYEALLNKWRFAPVGEAMFQGATGDYYRKVLEQKKAALPPGEAVRASKSIGW